MRSSLIAAGGALLAAAALFGSAGSAAADIGRDWDHWNEQYPGHCDLGLNDDTTYHHVTKHGVFAGTRDADSCKEQEKKEVGGNHYGDWEEKGSGDD
ncbi:hypothetical protein [Nonomuraea candida]|uniref:hypothetical protein n=1 Tax=Nonomuraea candida TaxID=359159 RepID=UPI0005B96C77|nr:hypothetical protein [Nonomuraea candida]